MLLSAAKILKNMEASLNGRVVLMFEEGEEGHRNIEKLLAYMAEKDMKFDTCYASHVRWDIPTGKLSCCQGSAMSGLYHFVLEINGKGGHGSRPDLAHSVIDCFHDIGLLWIDVYIDFIIFIFIMHSVFIFFDNCSCDIDLKLVIVCYE